MGDVADMMIDGTLCEECGVYLKGESFGVPRRCADCEELERRQMIEQILLRCPMCPAQMMVKRSPLDPPGAVVLELLCDRHSSADCDRPAKYYDANGEAVSA